MSVHPTFTDDHGVRVLAQRRLSDRLVELRLDSDALVAPVGTRILLPTGYEPDAQRRYPVLYLLHGGLGGFRNWTDYGDVERLTTDVEVIVVMPSGGTGGWYRDWHNFGRGGATGSTAEPAASRCGRRSTSTGSSPGSTVNSRPWPNRPTGRSRGCRWAGSVQ